MAAITHSKVNFGTNCIVLQMWANATQQSTLPTQTLCPWIQPHHSCKPQDLHILPLLGYYILSECVEQFLNVRLRLKARQAFGKKRQRKKTLEKSRINEFKEGCLSLYRQALKMRLKSLGTCYFLLNREMERRQDVTCCDAVWHPSAGSIHHPKPSRSLDVVHISENIKFLHSNP